MSDKLKIRTLWEAVTRLTVDRDAQKQRADELESRLDNLRTRDQEVDANVAALKRRMTGEYMDLQLRFDAMEKTLLDTQRKLRAERNKVRRLKRS